LPGKDHMGMWCNLALLSAQMKRYNSAISHMKQYLLLEPDGADALNAQDRIHEGEILMQKKGRKKELLTTIRNRS